MSVSFSTLRMFSSIISSNKFSGLFLFSSGTPIMQMLHILDVFPKVLQGFFVFYLFYFKFSFLSFALSK